MNYSSLALGFTISFLLVETAMTAPPNEQAETAIIPLDKIWAYEMPGTRDVKELESDKFDEAPRKNGGSLTSQILQYLPIPKPGQKAKAGFAVLGTDQEALREANAVLVEG